MKSFIKKKAGPALGFRTPDFFKNAKLSSANRFGSKFSASQFRTQHKGSS